MRSFWWSIFHSYSHIHIIIFKEHFIRQLTTKSQSEGIKYDRTLWILPCTLEEHLTYSGVLWFSRFLNVTTNFWSFIKVVVHTEWKLANISWCSGWWRTFQSTSYCVFNTSFFQTSISDLMNRRNLAAKMWDIEL